MSTRRYHLIPAPDLSTLPRARDARAAHVEDIVNRVTAEHDGDDDTLVEWLGLVRDILGPGVHAFAFEITTHGGEAADAQTRRATADAAIPGPSLATETDDVRVAVKRAWLVDVLTDAQAWTGDEQVRALVDPIVIVNGKAVSSRYVTPGAALGMLADAARGATAPPPPDDHGTETVDIPSNPALPL